jgi:dihydroorotase
MIELHSVNPARLLGVPGGTLAVGSPGDVTIFAERPWTVDVRLFHSKGKNTPFDGATFPRRAIATVVGGAVVYEHGRVMLRDEPVTA